MPRSTRKENTIAVSMAVIVIFASIFFTLYATGVIFSGGDSDSKGFRNITFTDAVVNCREETQSQFGTEIRNLVTDNHSSRYDEGSFSYKIFMKMDLYKKRGDGVTLNYVNCFVKASNGSISKYEIFEQTEKKEQERVLDDTNMFGMPKPKNK